MRKPLADQFNNVGFLLGFHQAAIDAAAHAIQEFQPVFQRRFRHFLPDIVTFLAVIEGPLAAKIASVNLDAGAIVRVAFPADFTFIGHRLEGCGEVDSGDGHCGDAFAAADKAHEFVCGCFDADA